MRRFILFTIITTASLSAQSSLKVAAATNKRVDLTWTGAATSYSVQRAPLGSSFSTIATANGTSYSDTTIDAYTTYQYQIAGSSTSNSVTVGPPPAGFSAAAPAPGAAASGIQDNYGYDMTMALDANGDPAFAFVFYDPNQDSDASDTPVLFRSWSRAQYVWNPIATVGVQGDIATTFRNTVSMAFDSSTGTWVVASENGLTSNRTIDIFTSTNGSAWAKKASLAGASEDIGGPSVASANGNIYIAYNEDYAGTQYYTGKLSSPVSTWQKKTMPLTTAFNMPDSGTNPSIALDSAGNPAIAAWVGDANQSYNQILLFWKPAGNIAPVTVTDSENNQTSTQVKLLFFGLQPRILMYAQRNDADFGVGDHFIHSEDGGTTWAKPVVIPPDGNSTTDFPFDMAIDSKGAIAIAFGQNGGTGDSAFGNPKLSKSTDLTNFTTSAAADVSITGSYDVYPGAIGLLYGGNDKLDLGWWQDGDNGTGVGVLLWREPPAGAGTTPVINTDGTGVMNGAINLPGSGIVAGSWVTIKGSNFSDATLNWSSSDFSNGLPTTLNNVQVLMNNSPAAMYYLLSNQINVQAPASVGPSGSVSVQVRRNGVPSNTVTVPSTATAPGIFPYSLDGGKTFYPAAVFLDGTLVGDPAVLASTRKAKAGDSLILFATGLGVSPAGIVINSPVTFGNDVTVTIGSAKASVGFTGLVAVGEWQINISVPAGLADGNYPIILTTGGVSSQTGVIVPITH